MVRPVPHAYELIAPSELRLRRDGARVILDPVVASRRSRWAWGIGTAGFAVMAAVPAVILARTGRSEYVFIPVGFVAMMWVLWMTMTALTRRGRAERGPVLIVDPGARVAEVPHDHARVEGVVKAVHLVRFRLSNRHRYTSRAHIVGPLRQVLVEVEGRGMVPVITGGLEGGVVEELRRLGAALGVEVREWEAPDEKIEEWP